MRNRGLVDDLRYGKQRQDRRSFLGWAFAGGVGGMIASDEPAVAAQGGADVWVISPADSLALYAQFLDEVKSDTVSDAVTPWRDGVSQLYRQMNFLWEGVDKIGVPHTSDPRIRQIRWLADIGRLHTDASWLLASGNLTEPAGQLLTTARIVEDGIRQTGRDLLREPPSKFDPGQDAFRRIIDLAAQVENHRQQVERLGNLAQATTHRIDRSVEEVRQRLVTASGLAAQASDSTANSQQRASARTQALATIREAVRLLGPRPEGVAQTGMLTPRLLLIDTLSDAERWIDRTASVQVTSAPQGGASSAQVYLVAQGDSGGLWGRVKSALQRTCDHWNGWHVGVVVAFMLPILPIQDQSVRRARVGGSLWWPEMVGLKPRDRQNLTNLLAQITT